MCSAARCEGHPSKKARKSPAVIEVPQSPVRDLPDGPREFLRQATQVVEANAGSGSQNPSNAAGESELCEATCPEVEFDCDTSWNIYWKILEHECLEFAQPLAQ